MKIKKEIDKVLDDHKYAPEPYRTVTTFNPVAPLSDLSERIKSVEEVKEGPWNVMIVKEGFSWDGTFEKLPDPVINLMMGKLEKDLNKKQQVEPIAPEVKVWKALRFLFIKAIEKWLGVKI